MSNHIQSSLQPTSPFQQSYQGPDDINLQFASIDGDTISFQMHNSFKNKLLQNIKPSKKHSKGLLKSPQLSMVKNYGESATFHNMKKQIDNLQGYDSFEISSFAQSKTANFKNPLSGYIKFPSDNAPSLQLTQLAKKSYHNNETLEQQISEMGRGEEDITERHPSPRLVQLENQVQGLKRSLSKKEDAINRAERANENLSKKLMQFEQTIEQQNRLLEQKDNLLKNLKKEIKLEPQKRKLSQNQTGQQKFCPEMLSPEESLRVLDILLKKVSKSTFMTKSVIKDHKVMQIILKLASSQHVPNISD